MRSGPNILVHNPPKTHSFLSTPETTVFDYRFSDRWWVPSMKECLRAKRYHDPLREMGVHEAAIATLIPRERRIRAQTILTEGVRIVPQPLQKAFQEYSKNIRAHKQALKKIEKAHAQEFKQLRKHQQDRLRLQGKEQVYTVDVELGQILTFHRVSLANLYTYFIKPLPPRARDEYGGAAASHYSPPRRD